MNDQTTTQIISEQIRNWNHEAEALSPETLTEALGNEQIFESLTRSELTDLCREVLDLS